VVLDERRDVLLLLHSAICEPCASLAPYFRKMAERFADMRIPSLVVARMDVTHDYPPTELGINLRSLPTIMFFPANNKAPPYRCAPAGGEGGEGCMALHVLVLSCVPGDRPPYNTTAGTTRASASRCP
jgi:hypothetical protein